LIGDSVSFEIDINLMQLYPKQREAIFNPAGLVLIEASTKSGKSDGCLVWQITQIITDPLHRLHYWLAPTRELAREMFYRAKQMLPTEVYIPNETSTMIRFINGARWAFMTDEDPDAIYGRGVGSVVVDEASRVKEASYHAVHSLTTTYGSPIRCIGNVRGRSNWFYRLCRRAEHGDLQGAAYRKLSWEDARDAGVMPADAYDRARNQYGCDAIVRELFYADPADDSQRNPFGTEFIERCITTKSICGSAVVYGWDLAGTQSKGADWTVGIGLNANGDICELHRWQQDTITTRQRIRDIVKDKPCLIDQSGIGGPIVQDLQETMPNVIGQKFADQQKQALMRGLASAISSVAVHFHALDHKVVIDELMAFEYEVSPRTGHIRWTAPVKQHDDCVMALAMAVEQKRKWFDNNRFGFDVLKYSRNTGGWHQLQRAGGVW
jgi:phage terminase large subunit-like protein